MLYYIYYVYISIYVYKYLYIYKWHACPGSYTAYWEHILAFVYRYTYTVYIYRLLPIAYCLLPVVAIKLDRGRGLKKVLLRLKDPGLGLSSLWDMVTRCCGFCEGLFLKVSSLSTRMQNFRMRGCAHSINWLRDQPFEQGMTMYIYRDIHYK